MCQLVAFLKENVTYISHLNKAVCLSTVILEKLKFGVEQVDNHQMTEISKLIFGALSLRQTD